MNSNINNANKVFNNNLNSMGLPMNKLNGMLTNLQSLMVCDTECRRRNHADLLKKNWLDAKAQKESIDTNIEDAERNYFSFIEGDFGYNQVLLERFKKSAEINKNESLNTHSKFMKTMNTLLASYKSLFDTYDNVIKLEEIKKEENNRLTLKIDNTISEIQTNDRKVVYEEWDTNQLNTSHTVIYYAYYIFLVLFVIYGPLFREKMYKNVLYVLSIILLFILPFLINRLSILIIHIYKKGFNILPVIKGN
jgi:hypothetical protein